jgi:hypothetical protein
MPAIRPDSSNNLRLMHLLFPRMISDPGSVILSRSHFVNGPLSLPEDGILSSGIKLCFDLRKTYVIPTTHAKLRRCDILMVRAKYSFTKENYTRVTCRNNICTSHPAVPAFFSTRLVLSARTLSASSKTREPNLSATSVNVLTVCSD